MTNLSVGQHIIIGASVWDFCGQQQNGIYVGDVKVNSQPVIDPEVQCQIIEGIGVTFKLVGIVGTSECANCTPGKVYFEIGTSTTDASGIAYKEHQVSEDYLAAYFDAVSLGFSLRLIACITDSKGQTIIEDKCSDTLIITHEYTETLQLFFRPWGWYTPQGAADKAATLLVDIDAELFKAITFDQTGYSYVRTDITVEGEDVILNIRIRRSPVQTMAEPLIPVWVVYTIAIIVVIIALIGVFWWFNRKEEGSPTPKASEPATPEQQKPGVERTITDWTATCLSGLPENPTCAELGTYALCLDVGHVGTYGVLISVYPKFEDFSKTYSKYLGIYKRIADECNPNIPGKTPADIKSDIEKTIEQEKKDTSANFDKLQKLYEKEHNCWIANPFDGCLLSSSTGTTIVGTLVLIAVIGGVYWAITRKPAETRVAIETAGRYAKGAAKAAGEEVSRARAGYRELRKPTVPTTSITPTTKTQEM